MVGPKTPMKGGHRPWFPLEVLGVCDMQRVKKNQESVLNQSKIIRVGIFAIFFLEKNTFFEKFDMGGLS